MFSKKGVLGFLCRHREKKLASSIQFLRVHRHCEKPQLSNTEWRPVDLRNNTSSVSELLQKKLYPYLKSVCPWSLAQFLRNGVVLPTHTPKSPPHQSNTLDTPGEMFQKSKNLCLIFQVMICLWVMIYKGNSFSAFHGAFAQCLLCDALLLKTSHIPPSDCFSRGLFFCTGHVRRRGNSREAQIPHFTFAACHWFLTQQRMFWYLAHRPYRPRCPQPNISSRFIRVQAEVSYRYSGEELLQYSPVLYSEVWSDCDRKHARPI